MILKPKKLGNKRLSKEELNVDRRKSIYYGPAGIGDKAIYLNSFYFKRYYYIPLVNVKRVFKRVAIAKGAIQASIPYLVVVYDDNREKQCIFKIEQDVDSMLDKIREVAPDIAIGKFVC